MSASYPDWMPDTNIAGIGRVNPSGEYTNRYLSAGIAWSAGCIPSASNAAIDNGYNQCCSARFTFNVSGSIAAANGSTYYPNRCTASPVTEAVTIGPMIVATEVVSDGITVDDELLVNGSIFQAGQYLATLGAGSTALGTSFGGGLSACNGQHSIASGTVLATVAQGASVTLRGGDNHGIDLFMRGAVLVRPVGAP